MSWSMQFRVNHGSVVDADRYRVDCERIAETSPEFAQQVRGAVNTALTIIDTGVLGSLSNEYAVSLSGHANPDHKPAAGWANDSLSINISQV